MSSPTLLGDLAAIGVSPLHLGIAIAVLAVTLALYGRAPKPCGTARLTYFEGHGRAEEVRLMLAACGVPWLDEVHGDEAGARFVTTQAQMRKMMAAGVLAMDQLPLLEIDGLHLVQHAAILRYLARRHNMYGSTLAEAAKIDILSDSMGDWAPITALMQARDASAAHAKYLARFTRALTSNADGDFLAGRSLSFADVQLFHALEQLANAGVVDLPGKWPALDAYRRRIRALGPIAAYVESGRQTPFPGAGGRDAFFQTVRATLPWVFGKAELPPLLSARWHFSKLGTSLSR
ncbi:hypothetical protein KFE25_012601 [Diacronema lutheri]|uniref:Glutathione transferase n=1 Tax=Diacronema lutheri TaxID=2081491 RepID=A0A8J5XIQ3_DIALT|nr:hypothetical protein KFE25_012601 [Diacronema lutheri]